MKITVGIPCYNAARWIAQSIQSALAQRDVEVEVIVVDDGSSDDSLAIAQEFDERVKVISGGHQGANHARNLVLQNATGDWVQYLDADDYLEPGKVITQLRESNDAQDADVLYSPVWIETWKGNSSSRTTSEISTDADIFTQWIRWHIPQTGGCLWRREALKRIGGWKEGQPCCQEHELYLRALMADLRFKFTPSPGAVYRIWSEETLCRKDPLLVIRVRTELFDTLLAHLKSHRTLTDIHRREIGRACFEMARTFAKHDLAGAATYLAEQSRRGLIHVSGPAAPLSYRVVYSMLGFRAAERLARWMRR